MPAQAWKPWYLWIGCALTLYLFFSLIYLHLPGLEYDELLFVNAALGNVDGTFVDWHPKVLGKRIPLMLMTYIGAPKAFLYAPIFKLFGTSPTTARLPVVLVGLITLLVTYAFVQRLLGRYAAISTLLLLASDPTFIFSNKLDWGPVALMLLLQVSSLYVVCRWIDEGRPRWLLAGSFLLGLGLYNKVVFIWYVTALTLALLLCFGARVRQLMTLRRLLLAVGVFVLGCLPLIAFNIKVPMATFQRRKAINQDWSSSLKDRYRLFLTTLDGSAAYDVVNHAGVAERIDPARIRQDGIPARFVNAMERLPRIRGTLIPFALILAMLVIVVSRFLRRLEQKREILFLLLQFGTMAVLICVTQAANGPHHTIAVYPFPHALIGFALYQLSRLGNLKTAVRSVIILLGVSPLILTQLIVDARYVESFVVGGGVGAWSDAIYELAAFAKQHPDKSYLLMDWGFSTQLLLLSDGRLKKEEAFVPLMFLPAGEKITRMKQFLSAKGSVLVFHAPPFETFPALEAFKSALALYGTESLPVRTFYQRDGRPIYIVYQVD
ncbi:MAG TPA: glycosyltransferase family 39 protein [Acidobacteriota bacterium]|nr:glycosyltransferase family 39 protein [Acidobacteriota bacterium]